MDTNIDYTKYSDSALLRQYIIGNDRAFNVLVKRYEYCIYNYLFHMCNAHELAQDLCQDTFMYFVLHIQKYNPGGIINLKAFLLKIARRRFCTFLYQRKYEIQTLELTDEIKNNHEPLCEDQNLRLIFDNTEYMIGMLPSHKASIVRMRVLNDYTFKDIASKQNIGKYTAVCYYEEAMLELKYSIVPRFDSNKKVTI